MSDEKGFAFNITHNDSARFCPSCGKVTLDGLPMNQQIVDLAEDLLLESVAGKRQIIGVLFDTDGSVRITISAEKERPTKVGWWARLLDLFS